MSALKVLRLACALVVERRGTRRTRSFAMRASTRCRAAGVLERTDVLIRNGKIAAVGAGSMRRRTRRSSMRLIVR